MGSGVFNPRPFKEITYKCTQSSTNAPAIAYTLGNTFGQDMVDSPPDFAYSAAGIYTLTKTDAWVADKTVATVVCNAAARVCYVTYTSADVITLTFFDAATPTAAESDAFDLIIRVYD
jgi:hypothetical protein